MLPLRDRSRTEIFVMDENKWQPVSERRINKLLGALKDMQPIEFFGVNYLVASFIVEKDIGNRSKWKFELKESFGASQ